MPPHSSTSSAPTATPSRDPRMNVVTVGYLAVLRDLPAPVAGTDAAAAAFVPVSEVLDGRRELAFDHARIVRDAVDRVRLELEVSGLATAFVGDTFTLAELRSVYEAVWGVRLDAANFRRSVADDGWVVPTGRRTRPGPSWRPAGRAVSSGHRLAHGRSHPPRTEEPIMRAAIHDRYGPPEVLRLEDVPEPSPGPGELLVRVHRSSVNRTDCGFRKADPIDRPPVRGHPPPARAGPRQRVRGVVEAIGAGVTRFAVGDRVFGVDQRTLRHQRRADDAPRRPHRSRRCPGSHVLRRRRRDVRWLHPRAHVPHGARLKAGQRILIYGATGSIGSSAVQLAHAWGAHVTAVADTADPRAGAFAGCRRGHRPDERGLHAQRAAVRHRVRRRGQALVRDCRRSVVKGGPYVTTDLGRFWHVPPAGVADRHHRPPRHTSGDARPSRRTASRMSRSSAGCGRRAASARSSTATTRSTRSSRRPASSSRAARSATSSSTSPDAGGATRRRTRLARAVG